MWSRRRRRRPRKFVEVERVPIKTGFVELGPVIDGPANTPKPEKIL